MLALRSIARALPRAPARLAPFRAAQRPIVISRSSILSRTTPYKSFSTTRIWREAAGDSDGELSAKLAHEHTLEVENQADKRLPDDLEDFLSDSTFKLQDQPGTENIILTKTFGNETIRVECSIADMNQENNIDDMDEDTALDDEAEAELESLTSGGKRTINQSKGGKVDVAPEDSLAPSDRDAEESDSTPEPFALNLSITIDKGAIGATNIIARAEDGVIEIEYVHLYPRAELIDPKTAETVKESQNVYGGPAFPYLDPDLQQMYDQYINERGINTRLAWFLSRYVEYKEQREYMLWLENMKKFIDA